MKLQSILIGFLLAGSSFAGPLDELTLLNSKVTIIKDFRLPPYVRIEADLFNDASSDLSGEWRFRDQHGFLELKQNGLDQITLYLWDNLALDTLRNSIEILWTSDIDETTTDTLHFPIKWRNAIRRDIAFNDEWTISEVNQDAGEGILYVTFFIPIPAKVSVVAYDHRLYPADTLFSEGNFRGFKRIDCLKEQFGTRIWTFKLFANNISMSEKKIIEPKYRARGSYYYGE